MFAPSQFVVRTGAEHLHRFHTGSTDDSPFPSSLTTPVDEEPLHCIQARAWLDAVPAKLEEQLSLQFSSAKRDISFDSRANPQTLSLSKNIKKAKSFAGTWRRSLKWVKAPSKGSGIMPHIARIVAEVTSRAHLSTALTPQKHIVYNMPNKSLGPFSLATLQRQHVSAAAGAERTVVDKTSRCIQAIISTSNANDASIETPLSALRHKAFVIGLVLLQIFCFVPWCVAVGACIVLTPQHLDPVCFGLGRIHAPRGIYRFAHWADCAMQHIAIFAASIIVVFSYSPGLGAAIGTAVLAQFVYSWHDFRVDKTIPLGFDDRQTMYFLITNRELDDTYVLCRPNGEVLPVSLEKSE